METLKHLACSKAEDEVCSAAGAWWSHFCCDVLAQVTTCLRWEQVRGHSSAPECFRLGCFTSSDTSSSVSTAPWNTTQPNSLSCEANCHSLGSSHPSNHNTYCISSGVIHTLNVYELPLSVFYWNKLWQLLKILSDKNTFFVIQAVPRLIRTAQEYVCVEISRARGAFLWRNNSIC